MSLKPPLIMLNFTSSTKKDVAPMIMTTQHLRTIQLMTKLVLIIWMSFGCNKKVLSQDWKLNHGFETYFGENAEDQGHAVIQTADRGFMLVGFSEDPVAIGGDNDFDIFVVRADIDGTLIWQKWLDKGWTEHGYDVIETPDNGFIIVGDIKETPAPSSNFEACLIKIDAEGNEQWFKTYGDTGVDRGIALIATTDGGILFTGRTDNGETTDEDIWLVKTDFDGNEIWSKSYPNTGSDSANSVLEVSDGYFVIGTVNNPDNDSKDLYLLKTDFLGNEEWHRFYGSDDFDQGYDIIETQDNQLAIVGSVGSNSDVILIKIDLSGNEIWNFVFGGEFGDQAFDFIQNESGEFVITGITEITDEDIEILLANVSEDGQTLNWMHALGRNGHVDWGQSIALTSDGGYAIAGYNSQFTTFINDLTLIKTNAGGNIFSNKIQGKVFIDNDNCDFDTDEQGLENWLIKAQSDELTFFGSTDADGNYNIQIDTGTYELSILTRNEYWMPCIDAYNVTLTIDYDTLVRNFPMIPEVDCSLLEVNVSTAVTQNCSNIGYQITYCNEGTINEENAYLEVVLDENMTFNSATLPLDSQTDSLLVFQLNTINVGECNTMAVSVATDCDLPTGIAYTLQAHIYPDSVCLPTTDWDEASIKVNGYCDIDSIRFEIENTGDGDMSEPLNFIVIEDVIMQLEAPYQLVSQQKKEVAFPSNGSTYRIIAEQSLNHPGNNYPTIAIEGCDNGTGNINTGNVTIYQENENDTQLSIDVQEATQLITNLSLRGYPKGYPKDGNNLIPTNTALEYHILFQNTGMDNVKRVVIRDTISQTLDISTVRPGVSSHDYDFEVYDNGILKFTFDNIELTSDGSENSYGFVTFKIDQKANNPEGTEIKNSAEIFMGYNIPIETATTFHHIGGEDIMAFIITEVHDVFVPNISVNAYPNPFIGGTVIEIDGETYTKLQLTVFDLNGRKIREENTSGQKIHLSRNNLTAGTYLFQLHGDDMWVASGKLIVQ